MLKVILAFGRWFVQGEVGFDGYGVTANIYADVLKSTKTKVADLISLKLS